MRVTKPIGIVGAGCWGTTLAVLLAKNNHPSLIWARSEDVVNEINLEQKNTRYFKKESAWLSKKISASSSLEYLCNECELIIVVVASQAFRTVTQSLSKYLKKNHILISAAKGLEISTHKRMSQILEEETPCPKIGVLSGPNLYKEILNNHPAATLIASREDSVVSIMMELFNGPVFRVYGNRDVVGVEICGAVKNIIALVAGIFDGMGLGDNAKAMLITRGAAEVSRIGMTYGANPLTFGGLAGIGDLVATCASSLSRNHKVGYLLARGETLDSIMQTIGSVTEGVYTTKAVYQIAHENNIDAPYTRSMYQLLYENKKLTEVLPQLMARATKYEY